MEALYFTADELEALDAAQAPAPVTRERQLQIVEEMGKQMGDLGKGAARSCGPVCCAVCVHVTGG